MKTRHPLYRPAHIFTVHTILFFNICDFHLKSFSHVLFLTHNFVKFLNDRKIIRKKHGLTSFFARSSFVSSIFYFRLFFLPFFFFYFEVFLY